MVLSLALLAGWLEGSADTMDGLRVTDLRGVMAWTLRIWYGLRSLAWLDGRLANGIFSSICLRISRVVT